MITTIKLCAVFLIALALSQHSPALAFAFIVACLVFHTLWRLLVFVARPFFLGFPGGLGVRKSGLLKQFQPRTRARRARSYFPWQEHGDDLPPEL
jgi:hypothetical protein